MIIKLVTYMLICLILTIAIELLVAIIIGVKDKLDLINVILVNILTNPLLVSIVNIVNIYSKNITISYIVLAILEIVVVFVEGLIYKKYLKYNKVNAINLSIVLNICSYFIGYFVLNLLGY